MSSDMPFLEVTLETLQTEFTLCSLLLLINEQKLFLNVCHIRRGPEINYRPIFTLETAVLYMCTVF